MTDRKGLGMEHPTDYRALYETVNDLLHQEREEIKALTRRLADAQATVEALQAIIKQMGEQAARLAKDGMAAKAQVEALQAQVSELQGIADEKCRCFLERAEQSEKQLTQCTAELEALQRERDDAVLLRDHNLRRCDVLDSKYKKGLAAVKVLQSQLSQLQALVRALPVPEEGGFPIVEVDGDYYVNHTSRFSTKAEADAYTGLLIYRATLDATTPATKGGDGE